MLRGEGARASCGSCIRPTLAAESTSIFFGVVALSASAQPTRRVRCDFVCLRARSVESPDKTDHGAHLGDGVDPGGGAQARGLTARGPEDLAHGDEHLKPRGRNAAAPRHLSRRIRFRQYVQASVQLGFSRSGFLRYFY